MLQTPKMSDSESCHEFESTEYLKPGYACHGISFVIDGRLYYVVETWSPTVDG